MASLPFEYARAAVNSRPQSSREPPGCAGKFIIRREREILRMYVMLLWGITCGATRSPISSSCLRSGKRHAFAPAVRTPAPSPAFRSIGTTSFTLVITLHYSNKRPNSMILICMHLYYILLSDRWRLKAFMQTQSPFPQCNFFTGLWSCPGPSRSRHCPLLITPTDWFIARP